MRLNIPMLRELGLSVEEQSEGVYDIHPAPLGRSLDSDVARLLDSAQLLSGTPAGDTAYQGIMDLLDEALVIQALQECSKGGRS